MGDTILMIFEGKKTEPNISDSIEKVFFNKKSNAIYAIWGCNIYSLYEEIKKDEYVDILRLLKEKRKLKIDKVSEIYMFFDSESKKIKYNVGKMKEMLEKFNNETKQGKLYISYPMVEALKHSKKDLSINYLGCIWNIYIKEHYKKYIGRITDYADINKLTFADWQQLISICVQKAYCLVYGKWKIPEYKEISNLHQSKILEHQKKFIAEDNLVSLSAFPFFILNYFGEKLYDKLQLDKYKKNCKFKCIINNYSQNFLHSP